MRVREVAAIAANGVIVLVLSGCSSATAPSWVPGWMTVKPEPQALRFESAPPGADVTVTVEPNQPPQNCKTPCALKLPLSKQSVTVVLNGYVPQTLAVDVRDAKDFNPNPVQVTLQAVHPKSHMPKSAKTAASSSQQQQAQAPAAGDAEQTAPKANQSGGRWCAEYNTGVSGTNCGFESFQQCLDTVRGMGGSCSPDLR